MIKAVFFDFDGVLTLNTSGTAQTCKYISEKSGVSYDLLLESFGTFKSELLLGYKKYSDILPKINALVNYEIDNQLLERAFLSTPENGGMFDLAAKLRNKGFKTGIITDNPLERFDVLERKFRLDSLFDSITVSSKVHSLKTEPIIFEAALKSLNLGAPQTAFIDNSGKNLEVPSKMGICAIYHDDKKNDIGLLVSELEKAGVR